MSARDPGARPVELRELVELLRALTASGTVTAEMTAIFNRLRAEAEGLDSGETPLA